MTLNMAAGDVDIKLFLIYKIFPICLLIFVLRLLFKNRKKIKGKLMAWALNRMISGVNKIVGKEKTQLFECLKIRQENSTSRIQLLEIGAGSGANFQYYPDYTEITCLEPNNECNSYLLNNVAVTGSDGRGVKVKQIIKGFAEKMSLIPDNSMDAVVSTLVLCSVRDTKKCMMEIKRVLKPVSFVHELTIINAVR